MNFNKKDRILFNKEKNLTIIFNEKSACSFFVKWFFYQIDLYKECEEYHKFPHKYRMEVFNLKNNNYTIEDIKKSNKIILVRNPFTRAVSSYLHSVKNNYIDNLRSHSFYDFVKYLKSINIKSCNGHHRSQFHPLVLEDDINIIKVENLFNDIKSIENKFNLLSSPIDDISNSLNFQKMKKDKSIKDFCYNEKFTKKYIESCKGIEFKRIDDLLIQKSDNNIGIPDYNYFYNDELISDIINIYKDDFKYFKYDENFII